MFFENYNNIGKNRMCLHGEQEPPRYTDKYYLKYGLPEDLFIILLGIEYVNNNKNLKKLLFGKIIINIVKKISKLKKVENFSFVSKKEYNILRNFIIDDLQTIRLNFPSIKTIKNINDKYYNYMKCYNNSHNNLIPEFKKYFYNELKFN